MATAASGDAYADGQEGEPTKKKSTFMSAVNKGISKISRPMNKAAMKLGCEPFSPQNLDFEFDKAARIVRSFCIDGFYTTDKTDSQEGSSHGSSHSHSSQSPKTTKVLQKIPPEVIRNCKGLAIFTTMRMGFHVSGAGGCGIVIAKMPDGQWSAPSGILIHTVGWGLVAGIDVYDCIAVINNDQGMEGFTRIRGTIGGEISATAGPLGAGKTLDSELAKRQAPVWTYMKSRGLYVGAQIDGTIIIERSEENARFYHKEGIRATQILNGEVQVPDGTMAKLWETLQAAEGNGFNAEGLPPPYEQTPGDLAAEAHEADRKQHDGTY